MTPEELPAGAIGYKKNMSDEELAGKHVDGLTGLVFATEEDYLNHVSPVTGHKPTEFAHMVATDENAQQRSLAARVRGTARKALEKLGVSPEEAIDLTKDLVESKDAIALVEKKKAELKPKKGESLAEL